MGRYLVLVGICVVLASGTRAWDVDQKLFVMQAMVC